MRWRYLLIFAFFILSFVSIWLKLGYWQLVKSEELARMGQAQYAQYLQIPPNRGDIDTSDLYPFVTNRMSYLVYGNPKLIENVTKIAQELSPLLAEDPASISSELSLNKVWVPLKRGIDNPTKEHIDALGIPGIGFQETPIRYYPEASMAAQLVGFVGKDTFGEDKGYFGLEGYYDWQLRGRVGRTTIIHDAFGKPVLAKLTEDSGQQDGRSLVLHVDRSIQYLVEQQLSAGILKYGAQSGTAAVMDPATGGILAMASFPSFDPRTFWQYDQSLYINPFITDTYEPGSTFKPLVMAAAFDTRILTPTDTCPQCAGPALVGGYAIHTWDDKYFPNTNMVDIMIHSDNTGMVYVAQKLGLTRMLSYLQKFGIGLQTGIDLQGESAPDIKPTDQWYPVDLATTGFGQGIAVTPIELLDAFCSIGNGGLRMEPHVVSQITTPDNKTITIPPKVLDRTISPITAKVMTEVLVDTVNKGEASFARLKGYRIAGKTGTASIAKDGHYDSQNTIASFEGFFPADNPKFCMLVVINEPQVSIYGSETAAPIFFNISRDLLNYSGILPTEADQ